MPPKKGKKGKGGKDDDWGDDKEVEEKLKKLMVVDNEGGEFRLLVMLRGDSVLRETFLQVMIILRIQKQTQRKGRQSLSRSLKLCLTKKRMVTSVKRRRCQL